MIKTKRPSHDQLRAEGRNAERARVKYLIAEYEAGKINLQQLLSRLRGNTTRVSHSLTPLPVFVKQ